MADTPVLEKAYNEDINVDGLVGEGWMHVKLYIEVQGNNQEACQKALERTVLDSLANEDPVRMLYVKFYELTKDEQKGFYSGVVEAELLLRDFRWFINVVMRYGPSAMEIIAPQSIKLNLDEMQSILADVSELSQTMSNQILSMLKEDERKKVYARMFGSGQ